MAESLFDHITQLSESEGENVERSESGISDIGFHLLFQL